MRENFEFDVMHHGKIPMLIIGDSPSGHTGLGRILRDVVLKIQENLGDVFDVAVLGGGTPPDNKRFPTLKHYPMMRVEDWLIHDLPLVWQAHSGGTEGIIFCIWDVSRLIWMAYPEQCTDPVVKDFLLKFKGKKWLYPAIDGSGPNGKMPAILQDALTKFDRVVNYTQFSAKITGYPDVLPHGIDTSVFYPRPNARSVSKKFGIELEPEEKLIGIVATNQPRKDWALAFCTLAQLKRNGIKARVWIHTDTDIRYWDLKELYVDFEVGPEIKVFLTPYGLPDDDLAMLYSACDITMGIGPEGFGYPIAESLCCGTPCVTGEYGGQSDFVPGCFIVEPTAFRHEGLFSIKRPVYSPIDFAHTIVEVFKISNSRQIEKPVCSWDDMWPLWEAWLRKGL